MEVLAAIFELHRIAGWIEWYGYPMLFLLLISNGVGVPIPEDIPVLVAGALVGSGHMDLGIAAFVCWCGIIGGDCILYSLGRRFGMNITRVRFVGRHLTPGRIEKAAELFDRYGVAVVAVARMFPGVRAAMVASAGTIRFNIVKFLIADGLAACLSGGLFLLLGYWFGRNLEEIRQKIASAQRSALAVLLLVVAAMALYFWWRRRKHRTISEAVMDKAMEHIHQHPKGPHRTVGKTSAEQG